jgi:hypothetical protein
MTTPVIRTPADAVAAVRVGLAWFIGLQRITRGATGTPEERATYIAEAGAARVEILDAVHTLRVLLAELQHPGPVLKGTVEIRTVEDLTGLAVNPHMPFEAIAELLDALVARDDDASEPIRLRVVPGRHGPRVTRLRVVPP